MPAFFYCVEIMMSRFIAILAALALVQGLARAGVRLVSSDQHSATIEYLMEEPEFVSLPDGQRMVVLPGCQTEGRPGAPGVLTCLARLGVPDRARVAMQLLAVESSDLQNFDLGPVPALVGSVQKELGAHRYLKDPVQYRRAGFLPESPTLLRVMERIRQHQTVAVVLAPVQYDPVGGRLRLNRRIVVRVSWDNPGRSGVFRRDRALEPALSQLLLNYEQARDWKVAQPTPGAKSTDPFAGHSVWYRLAVSEEGIYRLDYAYLLRNGIDPAAIDPRTIKIFSGGSAALPKDRNTPVSDTMVQSALWVSGQEDGRFDPGDFIVFFGQSLAGWSKNAGLITPQFFNPYTDTNCYWLTWGGEPGRRMAVRNCQPSPEPLVPLGSFTDTLHFEQEVFNPFNSGEFFYWANLRRSVSESVRRFSFPLNIPDPAGTQATVRLTVHAGINSKHRLRWGLNGSADRELAWTGGPVAGGADLLVNYELTDSLAVGNLLAGANSLTIDLLKENADSIDAVYLNWSEVTYPRQYRAARGRLWFRMDPTYQEICRIQVTGFGTDSCLILDIYRPDQPVLVATTEVYPAYLRFDDRWKNGNCYYAAASSSWLKPVKIEAYAPARLRQEYSDVQYLIISADQFWPQAQALLAHHQARPEKQPARAVKLSWVFNEYGFGLRDPAAIRNFLRDIYQASGGTSPAWCLLLGNGTYDYRNLGRSAPNSNLVPTHQEDVLNFVLDEYQLHAFDDWYAYFTTGQYPQFPIARLPAATAEEAWTAVNKSILYDSPRTFEPWRAQAVLVADDLSPDGTVHQSACENLFSKMPGYYRVDKVYGSAYPADASNHKPAARADLLRYWNQGAGVVNFVGHGAWWTWGHEWYLRDTDIPYLGNGSRLPLVITASCGVSRFDNPQYKCINSLAVTKAGGGAAATFGSTREGYGSANNNLNYNLYSSLFDSLLDLGRAVWVAKVASNNPANNQCYTLLGDPGMAFSRPGNTISLTAGADTLLGRGRYRIAGRVEAGGPYGGTVSLELLDIPRQNPDYLYLLPGNQVFRGAFPVVGDSFAAVVNIPDQLHISPVAGAKVRAYAWNGESDAAGATSGTLWIGGLAPDTMGLDTLPPLIRLYCGGAEVKPNDYLPSRARFEVAISDQSGINIAPGVSRYGEIKFSVYQNGRLQESYDLAGSFVYHRADETVSSGSASFDHEFKTGGAYQLKVEAFDTRLIGGKWEGAVNVETEMSIRLAYNYPNPAREGTHFTFMLSQPGDVSIRIFTVAGNLIRELNAPGLSSGYQQIYWDGRDDRGGRPANGVYLYQISARGQGDEKSQTGKLVLMR